MTEPATITYRRLDSDRISSAIETLRLRINERFPEAGLAQVAHELHTISTEQVERIARISRPHLPLRVAVGAIIAFAIVTLYYVVRLIDFSKTTADNVYSVLQGIEATFNILVLGIGSLLFLISSEQRFRNRRALRALAELRSIVHVIDMHQLTKDPTSMTEGGPPTAHSPERPLTAYQLSRYLDYCAELLALTGKVAALHAQHLPDPVIVEAVSDLERLSNTLAQKIWQKIAMIQTEQIAHAAQAQIKPPPA